MGVVDLRSDTMTRPTEAMRRAMAGADVGDDGWGEDPTVRRLEETFAARMGKPAAVFVPSGTMANQVALRTLAGAGQMVIAGRRQHVVMSEAGAAGVNGSFQLFTVDDPGGRLDLASVRDAVEGGIGHSPPVAAIAVENTHMVSGGRAVGPDHLEELAALGVAIHLDGARLFNASIALDCPVDRLAGCATTVTACLSKGLGAPVGSVVAGPADAIVEAREHRLRLGGGMRQAGILAAAGLVALETMVDRLAVDHARARRLASAAAQGFPDGIDPGTVDTNVVVLRHPDPVGLTARLGQQGVLAAPLGRAAVRFVTHLDVDDAGIDQACAALARSR
jgi:threonine aldolase